MKNYILTILFCTCLYSLNAQTINLKIGPAFSKMDWYNSLGSNTSFDESYTGLSTTLSANYLESKYFQLCSSIGYVNNGGKGKVKVIDPTNSDNDWMMDVKTQMNFITISTTANAKFKIGEKISTYVGVGPRLDYLMTYKEEGELLKQFDDINELNKLLFGFIGLAGINYNFKRMQLGLEFQYNHNLNKLVDYNSQWEVENQISVNYYTIAFSVGYKIK